MKTLCEINNKKLFFHCRNHRLYGSLSYIYHCYIVQTYLNIILLSDTIVFPVDGSLIKVQMLKINYKSETQCRNKIIDSIKVINDHSSNGSFTFVQFFAIHSTPAIGQSFLHESKDAKWSIDRFSSISFPFPTEGPIAVRTLGILECKFGRQLLSIDRTQ